MGNAYAKTILALLASLEPQSYNSGEKVFLDNNWLNRANSRNFHHVFPKAYLKKEQYEDWEINRVVNISLVDDFLNKALIRARPPSDYFEEFDDEYEDFESALETHLIKTNYDEDDTKACAGIWVDDYDKFVKERTKSIVKAFKKNLV